MGAGCGQAPVKNRSPLLVRKRHTENPEASRERSCYVCSRDCSGHKHATTVSLGVRAQTSDGLTLLYSVENERTGKLGFRRCKETVPRSAS